MRISLRICQTLTNVEKNEKRINKKQGKVEEYNYKSIHVKLRIKNQPSNA